MRILLLILSINIFILFFSCDNKSIFSFEEDIKKLIIWSDNEDNLISNRERPRPVSSATLAEIVNLEYFNFKKDIFIEESKNGIIIGIINFKDNEVDLNNKDKDLLVLISRAQKFEEFNIFIEANNIKFNTSEILDKIKQNLISNGVNEINISTSNISSSKEDLIIKIIKEL